MTLSGCDGFAGVAAAGGTAGAWGTGVFCANRDDVNDNANKAVQNFTLSWYRRATKFRPVPTIKKFIAGPQDAMFLADCEPVIPDLAQTILKRHGYRVISAENGQKGAGDPGCDYLRKRLTPDMPLAAVRRQLAD